MKVAFVEAFLDPQILMWLDVLGCFAACAVKILGKRKVNRLQEVTLSCGTLTLTTFFFCNFLLHVFPICRSYKGKEPVKDPQIIASHRAWNNVDYELYDRANETLWKVLAMQEDDYWDEVKKYKDYLERIDEYCEPVMTELRKNPKDIHKLMDEFESMELPETKWGEAMTVDVLWCAMAHIDIMPFYNILRAKQFPHICNYLSGVATLRPNAFRVDLRNNVVHMLPQFCANKTDDAPVPWEVLYMEAVYNWL